MMELDLYEFNKFIDTKIRSLEKDRVRLSRMFDIADENCDDTRYIEKDLSDDEHQIEVLCFLKEEINRRFV